MNYIDRLEEKIIVTLKKHGAPLSSKELASRTGYHINHVRVALKEMTRDRRLIRYVGPVYDLAADERVGT